MHGCVQNSADTTLTLYSSLCLPSAISSNFAHSLLKCLPRSNHHVPSVYSIRVLSLRETVIDQQPVLLPSDTSFSNRLRSERNRFPVQMQNVRNFNQHLHRCTGHCEKHIVAHVVELQPQYCKSPPHQELLPTLKQRRILESLLQAVHRMKWKRYNSGVSRAHHTPSSVSSHLCHPSPT